MSALEPKPTKQDLRVLKAVPREPGEELTIWQIGEVLETTELDDLERTLNGFQHLGYVGDALDHTRRRIVWWRTAKGDAAVENASSPSRSSE